MEILAHTLWTTAGVKKLNNDNNKLKNKPISYFWASFWGVFPDLFAFTIPFIYSFYRVLIKGETFGSFATRHQVADGFNLAHTLYQYSHSLVIFIIVFFLVWIILKRPYLAMLGWSLHILLDIPSHSISFFPTPFLFPISDYNFPYGIAWSTPWFMIINYIIIIIIWSFLLIKRAKNKSSI